MKWWSPCESIGVGVYKWTLNSCFPSWDFDKVNLYMVEPIGVGGVLKMHTSKRDTQRLAWAGAYQFKLVNRFVKN